MPIDSSKVQSSTSQQSNNVNPRAQIGSHKGYGTPNRTVALTEGQVLHGEITDLRNNEITITLTDNTTIVGRIDDNSNLYIGQTTSFKVSEISPRVISLQCLVNNFSNRQDITILKALEEAAMPKTERNKQLVQELMEYRMPINKQMLQQMIQQLASIKGTSISTLVLMNKYNMTVDPATALQFEGYRTGDHSLLQSIDNISEELPALLEALSTNGSASDVSEFGGQLMTILSRHIEGSSQPNISLNTTFLSPQEQNTLINYMNDFIQNNPAVKNFSFSPDYLTELTAGIANGSASVRDIASAVNLFQDMATQPDALGDNLQQTDASDGISPVIDKINQAMEYVKTNNHEISLIMNQDSRNSFIEQLKELKLEPSLIANIRNGSASAGDVFTSIQKAINSASEHTSESIARLFATDNFRNLFREIIKNSWTMSPRELKQDDCVQDYYKRLVDDLSKITSLIENNLSGSDSASVSNQTSGMNDNIHFMQQLNEMFSFVQLPIKLQDKTAHGDLYVYTKKDELKRHPEKISVLLHLDLNNIGALDIHISKNNNNIDTAFYCPDDFSTDLFKKNIGLLSDTLQEKGYNFNASVTKASKTPDIVDDFLALSSNSMNVSAKPNATRYTFDIRA